MSKSLHLWYMSIPYTPSHVRFGEHRISLLRAVRLQPGRSSKLDSTRPWTTCSWWHYLHRGIGPDDLWRFHTDSGLILWILSTKTYSVSQYNYMMIIKCLLFLLLLGEVCIVTGRKFPCCTPAELLFPSTQMLLTVIRMVFATPVTLPLSFCHTKLKSSRSQ